MRVWSKATNAETGGPTFHWQGSGAAGHPKLVPCDARVETGVGFSRVPDPKVPVAQNGDPVSTKKNESNQFWI